MKEFNDKEKNAYEKPSILIYEIEIEGAIMDVASPGTTTTMENYIEMNDDEL